MYRRASDHSKCRYELQHTLSAISEWEHEHASSSLIYVKNAGQFQQTMIHSQSTHQKVGRLKMFTSVVGANHVGFNAYMMTIKYLIYKKELTIRKRIVVIVLPTVTYTKKLIVTINKL